MPALWEQLGFLKAFLPTLIQCHNVSVECGGMTLQEEGGFFGSSPAAAPLANSAGANTTGEAPSNMVQNLWSLGDTAVPVQPDNLFPLPSQRWHWIIFLSPLRVPTVSVSPATSCSCLHPGRVLLACLVTVDHWSAKINELLRYPADCSLPFPSKAWTWAMVGRWAGGVPWLCLSWAFPLRPRTPVTFLTAAYSCCPLVTWSFLYEGFSCLKCHVVLASCSDSEE